MKKFIIFLFLILLCGCQIKKLIGPSGEDGVDGKDGQITTVIYHTNDITYFTTNFKPALSDYRTDIPGFFSDPFICFSNTNVQRGCIIDVWYNYMAPDYWRLIDTSKQIIQSNILYIQDMGYAFTNSEIVITIYLPE